MDCGGKHETKNVKYLSEIIRKIVSNELFSILEENYNIDNILEENYNIDNKFDLRRIVGLDVFMCTHEEPTYNSIMDMIKKETPIDFEIQINNQFYYLSSNNGDISDNYLWYAISKNIWEEY